MAITTLLSSRISCLLLLLIGATILPRDGWASEQDYRDLAATLPEEIAAAKREGLALTAADLRRNPPLTASKNAALLYKKIDRLYRARSEKDQTEEGDHLAAFLKPTRTAADRQYVKAVLVRDAELMRLAEQAAVLPGCDFDRSWEQGPDLLFPELATMRMLARLFAARAILEKEDGRPEAALRDVAFGARIGVHAGENPALIPFLVQIAIESIMDHPFVEVMQQYGSRPNVLQRAVETEKAFGSPLDIRHALRGELVMPLITMQDMRQPPNPMPNWLKDAAVMKSTPEQRKISADAWESRIVDLLRKINQGLSAAPSDLLRQAQALTQACQENMAHESEGGYEMSASLAPTYEKVPDKVMLVEATRRLRKGLVDLLLYRAAKGDFPETLSALSDAAALNDPFTDKPLLYHKVGGGFVLYSVSRDRQDDGGDNTRDKDGWQKDIAIHYPK